ncbi:MAG: AAA family ATPase, partial [Actinomycetota bacterium]|nr:AAA family ATPase [Actinomycetota bacterium]
MGALRGIRETCEPRGDVRGGQLSDLLFAASLDKIVREPDAYPVYGDAEDFFNVTHPTVGLKRLLERTFGRLSGNPVPGGEFGVIRSQTSFGGGKTHGLIAVYHLAKGARPSRLPEFVEPSLLPSECAVAAVVGDALDPVAGVGTAGERTYTMWGDIAAQLGNFDVMRKNDEERSAPGSSTWRDV